VRRVAPGLLALLSACVTHVSGLKPIDPAPDNPRVASVQPTLKWEPLPGADDARITDLVYDLRLLNDKGDVVVDRRSLASCEYTIEQPLRYNQAYTWTVRARFRWEGRRRQTEWSRLRDDKERPAVLVEPPAHYLPFRTPRSAAPEERGLE
jgi:hypothetical protein